MTIYGEHPDPVRRQKGHSIEKIENGTMFTARCKKPGCDWGITGLIGYPDPVEKAAYEHIRNPEGLIAGSSDILLPTRLAIAKANQSRND